MCFQPTGILGTRTTSLCPSKELSADSIPATPPTHHLTSIKRSAGLWWTAAQISTNSWWNLEGPLVWITVQVRYEPAKPDTDKRETFDQYLSATPTRIFKRDGKIIPTTNPYTDSLQILTNRIKEFNAKFIRDKSGLRLAGVLQFVLKMVKYQPLEGSGWQPLPTVLEDKKAIINIRNNDQRCFKYALLYFLERTNRPSKYCFRPSLYKEEMFQRYKLDTLPYPNHPNDVHLYKDKLQMNINVFSFFDDEGRARHPLVISRTNHKRVANLFYWTEHYSPISSIPHLFSDIKKHGHVHNICLRCLGHFFSPETLLRHQQLCTRDDFMSVLHVLSVPGTQRAQIKFNQFRNSSRAFFCNLR